MKITHCPICYEKLEVKLLTPCMECGAFEHELDHYKDHTYTEYELYFGLNLILCNFCAVDFGSYDPTHFGFKRGREIGFQDFVPSYISIEAELNLGKFCPSCNHPLPFLLFIDQCRERNALKELKNE